MHYSDGLHVSLETRLVKFDLIFGYKIFHGLVNLRFDIF